MGVSLNGGTPKTHQNDHFFVGKPMVVGYQHFRKPPYKASYSNFMFMADVQNFLVSTVDHGCIKMAELHVKSLISHLRLATCDPEICGVQKGFCFRPEKNSDKENLFERARRSASSSCSTP